jgi:hypothetical protein
MSKIITELRRAKKELGRQLKDKEVLQIIKLVRGESDSVDNLHDLNDYMTDAVKSRESAVVYKWAERKPKGRNVLDIRHKLSGLGIEGFDNDGRYSNNATDNTDRKNYADNDIDNKETDHVVNVTDDSSESIHTNSANQKINKIFNVKDKYYIQRKLTPHAQYQYAYVLLDTGNASTELSSGNKFVWKVTNFVSLETGVVSCVNNIRDIVGMRLFPVKANLISPINENGKIYYNNVVNVNNNFTILIEEFKAQSFIGRDGRKFHFVLFPAIMNLEEQKFGSPITPANPYIEYVTSGKGNGWFWFRTPITEFNTLTISMGTPFDLVALSSNTRTLIPIQFIYLAEK